MDPCTFQLIDGDRHFQVDRLNSFVVKTKFSDHGNSYSVVSVLGPQSSGKSTLLNCLFGTNFEVMGTFKGKFQTTRGIWMAKGCDIQPFTIVMDMEGTDGSVKEGDTTFDKQSALFALEISDALMINMWWKDVGLHEAGHRELLKTIFKFMVQLFKPRKTTLLFVLRDKGTKIPFEEIETYLNEDIEKIWGGLPKPEAHINTPLNEFFKVEIIALSSYDHMEDQFKQEVAAIRPRFLSSASTSQGGQVAADRRVVSASDFSDHAQKMWNLITQIRDLNISSIQEMVSIIRCDEIIKQKLDALSPAQLDKAIKVGPREFARELCSILNTCCSEYDKETKYYDEAIRIAKREVLEVKALERLRPAYDGMLNHLFVEAFKSFSTGLEEILEKGIDEKKDFAASVDSLEQSCVREFEEGCKEAALRRANWDASPYQETLVQSMNTLASWFKNQAKSQETLVHSIETLASWVKNQAKSQGNSAQSASTAVSGLAAVSAIAHAVASGSDLASDLASCGNCNFM